MFSHANQSVHLGGVVNAIFVFIAFLFSFPALFLPQNRGWLRAQGWFVVFCATFTLVLGVVVWFTTLQSRANLGAIWAKETPLTQSLLQQKV
jgi:protein-S-isoprenylcysteine O-methyltransferase Ste14